MAKREETKQMIELYRGGLTFKQIGERYGLTRQAVQQRLGYYGITIADRPKQNKVSSKVLAIDKARLEKLYSQKIPLDKILDELGIGIFVFYKALDFYGIPRRGWLLQTGGPVVDKMRGLAVGESFRYPRKSNNTHIRQHNAAKEFGFKVRTRRVGDEVEVTRIK